MKKYMTALPEDYTEVRHINAKDKKLGTILNLICAAVIAVIILCAVMIVFFADRHDFAYRITEPSYVAAPLIFAASIVTYIILHELLHGLAYKLLTGQKLTFGISWSCAFCGVPDIYTSRKTSLIALLTPFTVFTCLFVSLSVVMFFLNSTYFIFAMVLLGLHIGGCSGDLYMTGLLLFRYTSANTVIRDTGPEQFIYIKKEK